MVGRDVLLRVEKPPAKPGGVTARAFATSSVAPAASRSTDVTFDVRAGEIVGIAGVEGNGQRELIEAIAGLVDPARVSGEIALEGASLTGSTPGRGASAASRTFPKIAIGAGCCSSSASTRTRFSACTTGRPSRPGVLINDREVRRRTADIIQRFDVRPPNPGAARPGAVGRQPAEARSSAASSSCSRSCCSSRSRRAASTSARSSSSTASWSTLRDAGCAVLLVSAELEEVMSLSDRLLVIHKGRIAGEVDPATAQTARRSGC